MNTFSELHMPENTDSEHLFSVSIHLHGTISRQTKIFVYSKKPDFSEKSGFSENFMPENL